MTVPEWLTRRVALVALLAVALGLAVGYLLAEARPDANAATGIAGPAENAISLESGGWTYNVPLDVTWRAEDGMWHDEGRPECLPPGDSVQVNFWWVDLSSTGSGTRAVVAVDCRDAFISSPG